MPWVGTAREGKETAFYLLLFAGVLAFFIGVTWHYPGDVDEGFYAIAAELTAHGRVPYRDFFYPQTPVLPCLLALPIRLFGAGFLRERIYCSVFAAAGALLIAFAARREHLGKILTALLLALFCTHELVWQWVPSIRAYGPSTLFLVLTLVLIGDPSAKPSRRSCAFAGAACAVTIGCRLLFFPLAPVLLAAIWLRRSSRPFPRGMALLVLELAMGFGHAASLPVPCLLGVGIALSLVVLLFKNRAALASLPSIGAALGGMLVILLPIYFLLYRSAPEAFLFGNFGYHSLRSSGGAYTSWPDTLQDASAMLGAGGMFGAPSAAGAQFALLIALNVIGAGRSNSELRLGPWLAAAGLFVTGLRPNPINEHYFACCVPLLVMGAIGFGTPIPGAPADDPQKRRADLSLAAAALAIFLAGGRASMNQRILLGQFGPWDMANLRPADLDGARRMVAYESARHEGPILALWSGSAVGSAVKIVSGFEDHFARKVADHLTIDQRKKWHVATYGDFLQAVKTRVPALLVIDREGDQIDIKELETAAKDARYEQIRQGPAGIRIWARK